MEVTLKVKRASVLVFRYGGTDRISLTLDLPTAFPEMKYAVYASIEARHGYGVEWCRTNLGIEPDEIIEA